MHAPMRHEPIITDAPPTLGRAFGNAEVVALFERWLRNARDGRIEYAVVAACEKRDVLVDFAGSIENEACVLPVLDALKAEVTSSVTRREPPPQDPTLDASYFCYNAANQPISYDFLFALVAAEMERHREGAPAPLKVGFWRGLSGNLGLETEYRTQMFLNVVRPMLALIGAVEDDDAVAGRRYGFRIGEVVAATRRGEPAPRLIPSEAAFSYVRELLLLDEAPPVTITLREGRHWPHRNSNLDAWARFADVLQHSGQSVIVVRDTAEAYKPWAFPTCPAASISLDIRMALYESAKCNLFVSNGPATMASFGSKPILQFIKLSQGSEFYAETKEWWEKVATMHVGEQYPWCNSQQRLVWAADDYDNIVGAWNDLFSEVA